MAISKKAGRLPAREDAAEHEQAARRLAVQQAASRVLVEAATVDEAVSEILRNIATLLDWPLAAYYLLDGDADQLRCRSLWVSDELARAELVEVVRAETLARGVEPAGQALAHGEAVWLEDAPASGGARARLLTGAGLRAVAAFPVCAGAEIMGVIELYARDARPPDEEVRRMMAAIGHQICQALRRAEAQRRMAESEAHKAAVIAAALGAIVTVDARGRILELNPAAERLFGRAGVAMAGQPAVDCFCPPDGAPLASMLAGTAPAPAGAVEVAVRGPGGAEIPVALAIARTGEDPPCFTLYLNDLRRQARALAELRSSRDELGQILGALPYGVTVQDARGQIIYANQAAALASGVSSTAEMLAIPSEAAAARFEIWDENGRPLGFEELPGQQALSGSPRERLVRFRMRSPAPGLAQEPAEDRWAEVKAIPIGDGDGQVRYVVSVFQDVTAQRRAQRWQRLFAEANATLASAPDQGAILDGLANLLVGWMADVCAIDMRAPDGSIRRAAMARARGDRPLGGEPALARLGELSEGRPRLVDGADAAAAGLHSALLLPLCARGAVFGAVLLGTAGRAAVYGAVDLAEAEDFGRRLSISIDNLRLYREARDALSAREDLLAIVSHDLRNPLGVVLASSALLLKSSLPPEREERARRQVEAIQRAGHRMNRLIRDLLDFASIQGGGLSITRRPHDVAALVGEMVEVQRPLAAQKSQHLIDDAAALTLSVSCDHDRVIQVFSNVVGNAIKFTPEGGTVRVGATADGDFIRFTVTDTGPGIAADQLDSIFDRYVQAKRRNRDGIGLGLSIARGIVEAHGGRIWAESGPSGSSFSFTLPAAVTP
jgi:PAS domain S-box-containing protein